MDRLRLCVTVFPVFILATTESLSDQFQESDNTTMVKFSIKFYYTEEFAMVTKDIDGIINSIIEETNEGYTNSKVPLQAYALCKELAPIEEVYDSDAMLWNFQRMKGSDKDLLDTADSAQLLVTDFNVCGIANGNSVHLGKTFSVVKKPCALGTFTSGHEIGHTLGLSHNREDPKHINYYPNGYGHLIEQGNASEGLITIMSMTLKAQNFKTKVNYYSNPNVIHPISNTPTGIETENNAAVLLKNRFKLAAIGDESSCHGEPISHTIPFVPKPNGGVRLVGGPTQNVGNVEIEMTDGEYYSICPSGWSDEEAQVICRQLNYDGGYATAMKEFGLANTPFSMTNVDCNGEESSIQSCSYEMYFGCGTDQPSGAKCYKLPAPGGRVKLVGGNTENEGNVVVEMMDGSFSPVCHFYWNNRDAKVVCRQLNYLTGEGTLYSKFGNVNLNFGLFYVGCSGNESTLQSCPFANYDATNTCDGNSAAGAICSVVKPDGQIKLDGGRFSSEGNVMVEVLGGNFQNVCGYGWTEEDAQVVCRQLNYPLSSLSFERYNMSNSEYGMGYVSCTGNENSLQECTSSLPEENCGYPAKVICKHNVKPDGEIRLVGGKSINEGNVMVEMSNGEFKPICRNSWTDESTKVVCRQLNFTDGHILYNPDFGRVIPDFGMDTVRCTGHESSLQSCSFGYKAYCSEFYELAVSCNVQP